MLIRDGWILILVGSLDTMLVATLDSIDVLFLSFVLAGDFCTRLCFCFVDGFSDRCRWYCIDTESLGTISLSGWFFANNESSFCPMADPVANEVILSTLGTLRCCVVDFVFVVVVETTLGCLGTGCLVETVVLLLGGGIDVCVLISFFRS